MGRTRVFQRMADDAGVRRRVVSPRLRAVLREAGPEVRGRALAARRKLAREHRRAQVGPLVFTVFVVLMCVREIRRGGSWQYRSVFVGYLVLMQVIVIAVWWFGTGIKKEDIRQVALEHDLCPSCGRDLGAAEVNPATGRVRCGACGGEWTRQAAPRPAVCGACGYDLRGLEAGADGVTRCPECGAGWRFGPGAHFWEEEEGQEERELR